MPAKIKRIAVLNFQTVGSPGTQAIVDGQQVSNDLIAQITQEGYFQLVERQAVDRVTEELVRGSTIQYDRDTQKEIGRRLQADALILGSVSSSATETRGRVARTIKEATGQMQQVYNPATKQYYAMPVYRDRVIYEDSLSRDVSVRIDFRLVDVETDSIIASKSISLSQHEPERNFFNNQGVAVGAAIASLPDLQSMANKLTTQAARSFMEHISPHRLVVTRYLQEGGTAPTKQGYDLAKNGNWEMAKQSWEQAVRLNSGDFAAQNNLAIYYEGAGNNAEAEKHYKLACQLAPTNQEIQQNYVSFRQQVLRQ